MREPTPDHVAYAWYWAKMAGSNPQTDDTPHCGWFKRRLVKGGPFVPARIWLVSEVDEETGELLTDEIMQAECNGAFADPWHLWSWVNGHPIPEHEFRYMEALREHAARHEPDHPMADPRKPINNLTTPLHF